MATVKKTKTVVGKTVNQDVEKTSTTKTQENLFDGLVRWFNTLDRKNNIHMIIGVILLLVGLYLLRSWIIGLIFLILGILFVTGYFEKK